MDVGILVRWGKPVPGREQQATDLFAEGVEYLRKKVEAGTITFFEPFFMQTSDFEEFAGFFVIKGPLPEIFKLTEEYAYRELIAKGVLLTEHFKVDWLAVGDDISGRIEQMGKVRAELGL